MGLCRRENKIRPGNDLTGGEALTRIKRNGCMTNGKEMNMQELESLEAFMGDFVRTAGEQDVALDAAREYLQVHKEQLIKRIWHTLQELHGEGWRARLYIEKIQLDIVTVSDHYYGQLQSFTKGTKFHQLVGEFLGVLDDLYKYIREYFHFYFNDQLKIQQSLKDSHAPAIQKMARKIVQTLAAAGVNTALIRIIQDYLNSFGKNGLTEIKTVFQLDYLLTFATAIFNLVSDCDPEEIDVKLFKELIYLNFNGLAVVWHYLKQIQQDYDQVEFYQMEYIKVIVALRSLQQLPVTSGRGCEPQAASLKEHLSRAYEEEASCLKKLQRAQANITYKKWSERLFSPFYFHVCFNLEQVMFLLRMFMLAGIVKTTKKVVLFDFVVKHIETDEKNSFSPHSVKNKYNNPVYANAQKVKQALLAVIRMINEQFPE